MSGVEELQILAASLMQKRELKITDWQRLEDIIQKILYDKENFQLSSSLFRCLRNGCATSPDNQKKVIQSSLFIGLMHIVQDIIKRVEDVTVGEDAVVAARTGLQFLGNLIVKNEDARKLVWCTVSDKTLFLRWMCNRDHKISSFACFLLFNLLQSTFVQTDVSFIPDLLHALITRLSTTDCEWSLFSVEILLKADCFMIDTYPCISIDEKLMVLDIIIEQVLKQDSSSLHESSIIEISRLFRCLAVDIPSPLDEKKVFETGKLLSILCVASTISEPSVLLKKDSQLLETCVDVLACIHVLGKSGRSEVYAPIQSLSHDLPETHPTQGFKAQLVRLLGNLVHQSSANQDRVREMDGIPLILDCCNIDSKNPFIMQWCILAIRNLTEGNSRNQEALAAITLKEPTIAASPLLRELGLELTPDGKLGTQRRS